jgi:hypothetical protein
MTPQQQNALNAAQIQHDMVRRNQTVALLKSSLTNQPLIAVIQANDTARQAAGETIEYTPDALVYSGMIPGTVGLTTKSQGGTSTTKINQSSPPAAKNA